MVTPTLGYSWRYTKCTQKFLLLRIRSHLSRCTKCTENSELFTIASQLVIHVVTPEALRNLNFSVCAFTWVSVLLRQRQSKIGTFQDAVCVGYPTRYSEAIKNLKCSGYAPTCVSIALQEKH